jgi:aspartate aminotransferase
MIDCGAIMSHDPRLSDLGPASLARGLQGSAILGIAAEVRALRAQGVPVRNFTIGDFASERYAIPRQLKERIKGQLDAGQTNYPPAIGVPELRASIRALYKERLGLDYPEGCVQVGAGARPPLFAAYQTLLDPGDVVVYPVPSWNVRYYVYLNQAKGVPLVTRPEDGFMPTAEMLAPHLSTARIVMMNSPLNPAGTAISRELLTDICNAIVDENRRRLAANERPVFLVYDQVYWQLTFGDTEHFTPVGLVPEMASYTVFIDAISKCWAGTGLRVGWAVVPPFLRAKMGPLVGHMGAWAGRAEQMATAEMLTDDASIQPFMADFRGGLEASLDSLHLGFESMRSDGLPVQSMAPQGAIYLSVHMDLIGTTLASGRTLATDDDLRRWLLEEAHVAVVPFTAFGYPEGTGWFRMSVGAVGPEDVADALQRIRGLLTAR